MAQCKIPDFRVCRPGKHLQGAELKLRQIPWQKMEDMEDITVAIQGNGLGTCSCQLLKKHQEMQLQSEKYKISAKEVILRELHTCACNIWSCTVSIARKQQKRPLCFLTLAITCFGVSLQYFLQSIYHCKHYLTAPRIPEDQD